MEWKSNIRKFNAYSFVSSMLFSIPILVLFFQDNGLSLTQIMILQSLFAIFVILLEVPTGTIADRYGYRRSMLLGVTIWALGWVIYSLGHNFFQFLIAELVLSLGCSFISGADSAFLFGTLKLMKKDSLFKKFKGHANSLGLIGGAVSAILGGFIAHYSLRLTLFLTVVPAFVSFFLVKSMQEPQHYKKVIKPEYSYLVKDSFRFIFKHKLVRWFAIFSAMQVAVGISGFWVYQPYMQLSGVKIAYFGIIFASFTTVAALASKYAYEFESYFGRNISLVFIALFTVIPFFLMAKFVFLLSFVFIFLMQLGRGLIDPIVTHSILEYTYRDKRATVLSLVSMLGRVLFAVFSPFFGWMVDAWTLLDALWMFGIMVTIAYTALFIYYKLLPEKYFKIKKSIIKQR